MSYTFTNAFTLTPKADIDWETSVFGLLLVKQGSSAAGAGEPNAQFLSSFTALMECDFSGYARKTPIAGKTISANTTAKRGEWTFTAFTFSLGSSVTPVVGAILYWDTGGSDGTRMPLEYFDTPGYFPFYGGRDVPISPSVGGSVRFY